MEFHVNIQYTRVVPESRRLLLSHETVYQEFSEMCIIFLYIHFINILYKYGWNHSLNNKVMNVCLTMCQRVRSTSQIILLYFQRGVVKCFVYSPFI